jgi:fumarate hydratase subunit beta
VRISEPFDKSKLASLKPGDQVELTGTVYTARDAAHKRILELSDVGKPLPFDLNGAIIYYAGPSPAPPGRPIGSIGPTTSARMDVFLPRMLELGVAATIGKGPRSPEACEANRKHGAVYFIALGGAGALLATKVKACELIAFPELGPEAVYKLFVEEFPVIVGG